MDAAERLRFFESYSSKKAAGHKSYARREFRTSGDRGFLYRFLKQVRDRSAYSKVRDTVTFCLNVVMLLASIVAGMNVFGLLSRSFDRPGALNPVINAFAILLLAYLLKHVLLVFLDMADFWLLQVMEGKKKK